MIENIEKIKEEIQDYAEVKLDLLKLHTAEHLSKLIISAATLVIVGFMLSLILLLISFTAAYFIGSLLHSNEAGFLCVSGFYMLMLTFFLIYRKKMIEKPIIRAVISFLFPKFSDDENKA